MLRIPKAHLQRRTDIGSHVRIDQHLPLQRTTTAAYLIADTKLTNPDLYEQYKLLAKPIAEKYGGEYQARGGDLSVKENTLWSPTRMVMLRFPTTQQAEAFYGSTAYQEALKISQQSAIRTVFILEGV